MNFIYSICAAAASPQQHKLNIIYYGILTESQYSDKGDRLIYRCFIFLSWWMEFGVAHAAQQLWPDGLQARALYPRGGEEINKMEAV